MKSEMTSKVKGRVKYGWKLNERYRKRHDYVRKLRLIGMDNQSTIRETYDHEKWRVRSCWVNDLEKGLEVYDHDWKGTIIGGEWTVLTESIRSLSKSIRSWFKKSWLKVYDLDRKSTILHQLYTALIERKRSFAENIRWFDEEIRSFI